MKRLGEFGDAVKPMIQDMRKATRTSNWAFDSATILGGVSDVQGNRHYPKAKAGDLIAAAYLANDFISGRFIDELSTEYRQDNPIFVAVQGHESSSVNQIPLGMAMKIGEATGFDVDTDIIQDNKAGHTKSSGWHRLATQALFSGAIVAGRKYVVIDDFIGRAEYQWP